MPTLADASLSAVERRSLLALVDALVADLGERLVAVWLYGSRARGERPGPESDVDVLVLLDELRPGDRDQVARVAWSAVEAAGGGPAFFVPKTRDVAWLGQRRAIDAFFVRELERDRIVLAGAEA